MKEYPVFVPFGPERLAGIVTVPDGEARGLVVLSTGVGAPRSHRFQVWAIIAERLARLDIASIRCEYLGLHDSTGEVTAASLEEVPTDQVLTVARFGQQAVGTRYVLAAGNCFGAQASLSLAAESKDCIGCICLLPRTVRPGRLSMLIHTIAAGRAVRVLRSRGRLRRVARTLRRLNLKTRPFLREALPRALGHARVVFMVDEEHRTRMNRLKKLNSVLDRVPASDRARFELQILDGADLDRFGSLATQRTVIELIPSWIDRRLMEAESGEDRAGIDPRGQMA